MWHVTRWSRAWAGRVRSPTSFQFHILLILQGLKASTFNTKFSLSRMLAIHLTCELSLGSGDHYLSIFSECFTRSLFHLRLNISTNATDGPESAPDGYPLVVNPRTRFKFVRFGWLVGKFCNATFVEFNMVAFPCEAQGIIHWQGEESSVCEHPQIPFAR